MWVKSDEFLSRCLGDEYLLPTKFFADKFFTDGFFTDKVAKELDLKIGKVVEQLWRKSVLTQKRLFCFLFFS